MIFRNKIFAISVFTCLILIAAVITDYFFRQERKPAGIVSRFEKRLFEKEARIENIFQEVESKIKTGNSTTGILDQYDRLFTTHGIQILLFRSDTLIGWSDNRVPFAFSDQQRIPDNRLVQLANGWYRIITKQVDTYLLTGAILLKYEFGYQNDYLVNEFQQDFRIGQQVKILVDPGKYNVNDKDGSFLLALDIPGRIKPGNKQAMILFVLYLTALLCFISLLFQLYLKLRKWIRNRLVTVVAFIIDVIIIRGLVFYFKIPGSLYESDLFGPAYYASSFLLPSLGDLIVNSFLVLFMAYAVFVVVKTDRKPEKQPGWLKALVSITLLLLVHCIFTAMAFIWQGLVIDSNISLNLNNVFALTLPSVLGFIVIATLVLTFYLATFKIIIQASEYLPSMAAWVIGIIVSLALFIAACLLLKGSCDWIYIVFLAVYLLSFRIVNRNKLTRISFYKAIFYLVLFSVITSYGLHKFNSSKERESRQLLAVKLSTERDKLAEYMFAEASGDMLADTMLAKRIGTALLNEDEEMALTETIIQDYLGYFRSKYNFQLTICDETRELNIQPENYITGCQSFFGEIIFRQGESTAAPNLYYLNDGTEDINYIGVVRFPGDSSSMTGGINLYIELYSKFVPKALGYPELLIDKKTSDFTDVSDYSYAIYRDGELLKSVGNYVYQTNEDTTRMRTGEFSFFRHNHYNHLYYEMQDNSHLYVSKQEESFADIVAPFSYLIIFFGIYLLLFLLLLYFPLHTQSLEVNFKSRMQVSIIAIILVSFLVIGITSSFYIIRLNDDKNLDILSEKAHSVLIELEHKLADVPGLDPSLRGYLDGLLTKFSQVFFSDINIYALDGHLLASSRTEIFDEGLMSVLMDAGAYEQLAVKNKTLYIHEEQIGNYVYLSAYVPFRNEQNQLIAYLNLPYFARQTELRSELSTFLIAFTNIYIILIAIAIFVALIISNYITLPLQIIREKMSKLKLGKPNEKIKWDRKDEIGNLIMEYNRMIDELTESAHLLARSERESAWREMAKQVAHEIKNPLTPMKLSIQYLEKAWEEKAPDWDQRLKRFTQTVIQQIDNLSAIASEFSDFAKMPQSEMEKIDLTQVIQDAIGLFKDVQQIRFTSNAQQQAPCYVFADNKQMLRVFNNLIKNSIQAIKDPSIGSIEINIRKETMSYLISVKDNGSGIEKEQAAKIFTPSFTTKSGGMGLGLAIVQSIVQSSGGEIWFESDTTQGTTFYIRLPEMIT